MDYARGRIRKCVHLSFQADNSLPENKVISEVLKKEDLLKTHMKKLMPFVQYVKVCPFCLGFYSSSFTYLPLCPPAISISEGN